MLKKIADKILWKKQDKKDLKEFRNNRQSFQQYIEYVGFQTHLPALHIIKQNNIHKYREQYGFRTFVETGTFLGDMVEAQRNHFAKVYSVELAEELHKKAVKRFENYQNVTILQGDSGVVLKTLITEIKEPALFWLDGHYSAGITAKADKDTPIMEELNTILDAPLSHGIMIDDARLFVGKDDYPTINEIVNFVAQKDPERTVAIADDIIRIFKK